MRNSLVLIALFFAVEANAQWGGFLDPGIIQRAGSAAATGNLYMGNMNMDNVRVGPLPQARAPSAAEVAEEMRRQQQQEKNAAESRRRQALEARVRTGLAAAYQADLGR